MSIMHGKRRHPIRHAPRFDEALTLDDFPDAPAGAIVSEEGWLVYGQQAWTIEEWLEVPSWRPRARAGSSRRRPSREAPARYATDEERREARRRSGREHNRRKREEWYQAGLTSEGKPRRKAAA